MKAIVVSRYGDPEGLELVETDTPVPKENELLIKIHATTVTFGDAMLRRMKFPVRHIFGLFMGGLGKDKILGHEFAGEVEAVGTEVTLFKPGDQVFGSAGMKGGTHAEYISLPEDAMVAIKPENMTFVEAAAIPVGAHTALYILREANIQTGQKVLVYGASGSVGSYATQLAKYWGAEVTTVSSTSNLDWLRDLGVDHTIDYKKTDFTQSGETYDVIFDAVRKISSSKCKGVLKENGVFLSVSASTEEKPENLIFLRELIEAGNLKPVIDRTFPLDEIVEAHRYVDTGRKKGNVVITVVQKDKN
ncbi:MAG: NAD(P)-dependent alcohol dehydrogenase [Candidatus Thorarchaeota archaeon]|jgi:NADPH:quinone reductase-like Zn-dependent oxidoreductase